MTKIALACVWAGAAVLLAGAPQARADDRPVCNPGSGGGTGCAFYSPTHKINCEISYQIVGGTGAASPDGVYCEEGQSQSVNMDVIGGFKTCNGAGCVGNPGMNTPTLSYGQSAAAGPFTCLSAISGMTCTVPSGRGFTISSAGIVPV